MTALVWCPFPNEESARVVVATLLDERIVACANIAPGLQSLFIWNDERHECAEVGVLLKTDSSLLESVISRMESLHPYDEPAILGWHCNAANEATQAWLGKLGADSGKDEQA